MRHLDECCTVLQGHRSQPHVCEIQLRQGLAGVETELFQGSPAFDGVHLPTTMPLSRDQNTALPNPQLFTLIPYESQKHSQICCFVQLDKLRNSEYFVESQSWEI